MTCLVDQVTAHLNVDVLSSIASNEPAPASLPAAVKAAFFESFDRCLPADVGRDLRQRFGG